MDLSRSGYFGEGAPGAVFDDDVLSARRARCKGDVPDT
jgi:hypothetical protein